MSQNDLTPETEQRLADYLAGTLDDTARRAFEQEILADDRLATALYGELNLDGSLAGAQEAAPARVEPLQERARVVKLAPRPWWREWGLKLAIPAAAAAALLVALPQVIRNGDTPEVFRGNGDRPQAVSPVGEIDGFPAKFEWTPDPQAERYRFELYDAELRLVHRAVVTGSEIALPAGVLGTGTIREAHWRVVPIDASGVERPSTPMTSFTILP